MRCCGSESLKPIPFQTQLERKKTGPTLHGHAYNTQKMKPLPRTNFNIRFFSPQQLATRVCIYHIHAHAERRAYHAEGKKKKKHLVEELQASMRPSQCHHATIFVRPCSPGFAGENRLVNSPPKQKGVIRILRVNSLRIAVPSRSLSPKRGCSLPSKG